MAIVHLSLIARQAAVEAAVATAFINNAARAFAMQGRFSYASTFYTISGASTTAAAVCKLSSADFAYLDATLESLRAYTYGETGVVSQVGNGLAVSGISDPALCTLDTTSVAFIDASIEFLRKYSFDGTDWSQVGNQLALTGIVAPALTNLSSSGVALVDEGTAEIRAYSFDGTDWSQAGDSLQISGIQDPAMCTLDGGDIVLIDSNAATLQRYAWDGTNFLNVGAALSLPGISSPAICSAGTNSVIVYDDTDILYTQYSYSGGSWSADEGVAAAFPVNSSPPAAGPGAIDMEALSPTQFVSLNGQLSSGLRIGIVDNGIPADIVADGYTFVGEPVADAVSSEVTYSGNSADGSGNLDPVVTPLDITVTSGRASPILFGWVGTVSRRKMLFDVTGPGGGGTLELPTVDMADGDIIRISALSLNFPAEWVS